MESSAGESIHGPVPSSGGLVAGKYLLGKELGRGGMGVVFAARHEVLHQDVAIKFLLPELASDAGFATRFLNEARAAARIRGNHVATVLDADLGAGGIPFIVMEYLEGTTLEEELGKLGRLPVKDAVRYVVEALDALAQAHALGIVHRDLKPGNLFLTLRADGTRSVKLLDFGVSKLRQILPEGAAEGLTSPNSLLGSPMYMPPEQIHDAASVDERADVWSAGVVLYRMVTGRLPFEARSASASLVAILSQPPAPMEPELPRELERIVFRCLEKDVRHRMASVSELAEALLPFAPEEQVLVQRIRAAQSPTAGPVERTLVVGGDGIDTGVRRKIGHDETEPRASSRRTPLRASTPGVATLAAALAAVVALLLALAGFVWLSL